MTKSRDDTRTFSISELAREFDVTTRSIRFYEDQGLLNPTRQGQHRIYSRQDRVRLKLTLRGKRLGFSLAEIRELFDLCGEHGGFGDVLFAAADAVPGFGEEATLPGA